jgi:hypothetical protein
VPSGRYLHSTCLWRFRLHQISAALLQFIHGVQKLFWSHDVVTVEDRACLAATDAHGNLFLNTEVRQLASRVAAGGNGMTAAERVQLPQGQMHGNASASGHQVAIVESSSDLIASHARRDRIPAAPAEILSKGWCNRRTLSTCGGFPLLVRWPRARGSLGDTSDIQLPNQRTALFRLARVHLYQQN